MDTLSIIERSLPIFKKRPEVLNVELVGSFAKGTQHDNSDLDFLVRYDPSSLDSTSIMDIIELQIELEKVFNKKVDIIDESSLVSNWAKKAFLDAPTNIPLYKKA